MTDPGRISPTTAAGISVGARAARHGRGRDHDVEVGDPRLERRLLRRLLLGRELLRVAALGLLAVHAEVEERRAERLHLLRHRRPHVEGRHDRAEPPRGRDRLQPGDARPQHEHARGGDRAGRRHQQREHLRAPVGGEQHRLVAGDRRLRRERIHRLRARDPRDRLHREGDDAPLAQALDALRVARAARGSRSGRCRAPARRPRRRSGGRRGRQRRTRDGAPRAELGARRRVRLVGESGCGAGAALDHDLEAGERSAADRLRGERHPVLAGRCLAGHEDSHSARNLREGIWAWEGNLTARAPSRDLESALDAYDPLLGAHAARVAANAEAVATRLGWNEARLDALRLGAALHDVGKVNVRPEVLAKPGTLDEGELAEIRAHPVEGAVAPRGRARARARRSRTCSSTTSAGTATATRRGGPERRSRSRVACSPSATHSTR